MFGKPTFSSGSNTSAFGGSSLFGSQAKPVGFGSSSTTSSLFGQKPLFGSGQTTSLFGSTQPTSSATTSIFGQQKQLFGGSATSQPSSFGSTSLFGGSQTSTSGNIFGSSFGSSMQSGSVVKFDPPIGSDTMMRNTGQQNINTKHMCISAMKSYESKCPDLFLTLNIRSGKFKELRYEDYLANRKGVQSSGLTFGQTAQNTASSTGSLFGGAATTQSSLFGQSKSIFGTSSFGTTTTTTQSLFSSTPMTSSTSLFGAKPATSGLFGSTTGTSAFGQPQASTSIFGAKPTTAFGSSGGSLFGGTSTFGSTATTASAFNFGSNTTSTTPFGQTQQTGFGGFGQSSSAATGIFGSKPATAGFGGFGTSTTSTFGSQLQGGGLFGSKPGGLFGSGQGGTLFGSQPTTSTSLFSSSAAKPTTSLFGSSNQPTFGSMTGTAPQVVTAPVAPIVLGADLSQTILSHTLIQKQIQGSSYGDCSLLKLGSMEDLEKSNLPNPTNVERQLQFLNSKATAIKTSATPAVVLPKPLKKFSFVGSDYSNRSNSSLGDLSYRSAFSTASPSSFTPSHRSKYNTAVNEIAHSVSDKGDPSADTEKSAGVNVKRLDLKLLHKILRGDRETPSSSSLRSLTPSTPQDKTNREELIDKTRRDDRVHVVEIGENDPTAEGDSKLIAESNRGISSYSTSTSTNTESPRSDENKAKKTCDVTVQTTVAPAKSLSSSIAPASRNDQQIRSRSARITLTRRDYECEPSIDELEALAAKNNGVCHIEKGFTVRRLAYGSVFWPGPFDLSNVDLDEIIFFRRHEVVVYPDDDNKPPVGESLNRFAEISLERVWPQDKKTREYVTDPSHIEASGFRARLERASARIGAKFKDYRPECGTWVFTVPHFTKYGLIDSDDEDDIPSAEQLKLSMIDKKKQFSVQRSRLISVENRICETNEYSVEENDGESEEMLAKAGLGGEYNSIIESKSKYASRKFIEEFGDTMDEREDFETSKKMEICTDYSRQLDEVYHDSIMEVDQPKKRAVCRKRVKKMDIEKMVPFEKSMINSICLSRKTLIDHSLFNMGRNRVGWTSNGLIAVNDHPSFGVNLVKLQYSESGTPEFMKELLVANQSHSLFTFPPSIGEREAELVGIETKKDYVSLIDSYINLSDRHDQIFESGIFGLCKALFVMSEMDQSEDLQRRHNIGAWLRNFIERCASVLEKKDCSLGASPVKRILSELHNGNMEGAISEAIASDFPHLALSLSTFSYHSREAHKDQIDYWMKTGEIEFVDEDLLKIYMMMSGSSSLQLKRKKILVNEGLEWIKALGVFIWYYDPEASLMKILTEFEADFNEREPENGFTSVFFELMKLAADTSYPLENVLEPSCMPADCFDLHNSWHLWSVLYSVGYRHLHSSVESSLITGYAEQLYQLDFPHLSAFVLLHDPDANSRRGNILNLMQRIGVNLTEEMCSQLLEFCRLQNDIVAVARYYHARSLNNYNDMCEYALTACMLDEAHEVFIEKVAPKAVIDDNYNLLNRFDEAFDPNIFNIANWASYGQVFFDFCRLKRGIQEIVDDSQIEKLLEVARSLEIRLHDFPVKTSLQRLSIKIMSNFVFELLNKLESHERAVLPISLENMVKFGSFPFIQGARHLTPTIDNEQRCES